MKTLRDLLNLEGFFDWMLFLQNGFYEFFSTRHLEPSRLRMHPDNDEDRHQEID